jgi:hypothetical protein
MHESNVEIVKAPEFPMFCFQCEQTAQGRACTQIGVCGKNPEVAALQDLLIYSLKGLSIVASEGRKRGIYDREIDRFVCEAAFSTLTNVNFDPERIADLVRKTITYRDRLNKLVKAKLPDEVVNFVPNRERRSASKQSPTRAVMSTACVGRLSTGLRGYAPTLITPLYSGRRMRVYMPSLREASQQRPTLHWG